MPLIKRYTPLLFLALLLPVLSSCGQPFWLPPVHKIEVQQGNLVSQGQRDRIQLGMTRQDIVAIAGEPVVQNVFQGDRWDYLYTMGPAGSPVVARGLALFFENDIVVNIKDNYELESGEVPIERYWWQRLLSRR